MNNLIRNELHKIFHEKVVLVIFGLLFLSIFISSNYKINEFFYNNYIVNSETTFNASNYNLENEFDRNNYLSDKTAFEIEKDAKSFNSKFKTQKLSELGFTYKYLMNEAELNKNIEEYEKNKMLYEELLNEIKNNDYLYYYNKDFKSIGEELEITKEKYNNSTSNKERKNLKLSIDDLELKLEIVKVKIDEKLDPDIKENEGVLNTLEIYYDSAFSYINSKKDKSLYKSQSDYENYVLMEKQYFIYKYKVENRIPTESDYKKTIAEENISESSERSNLLIIVLIAVLGGGIIAEEFNKGTVKQLLVRPYSRTKVLFSKIIAIFIVSLIFILLNLGLNIILYGINYGFDFITHNNLVYNFNTQSVKEVNVILYSLLRTIGILPQYIIIILSAILFSVLTLKSNISNALAFLIGFSKNISSVFDYGYTIKFYEYVPYNCWNLGEYMFGGIGEYIKSSLLKSSIVCILVIALLIVLQIIFFKKKDIKNQ